MIIILIIIIIIMCIYIYIYIYILRAVSIQRFRTLRVSKGPNRDTSCKLALLQSAVAAGISSGIVQLIVIRPVHLSRVSLLRVLESNFPGDPLSNSTDKRIRIPENLESA